MPDFVNRRHQNSKYHQDAVRKVAGTPQKDVGELLSRSHSSEKLQNGKMLITIMESLQFLGRQSIAMRGHDDYESNFIQLLKLRSSDNEVSLFKLLAV